MKFEEGVGRWCSNIPGIDIEANLGGNDDGVFQINEEMAKYVENNFIEILEQATLYISKHVRSGHTIAGTPDPQWIECGLSNYGERNEFELFFSDKNTYTLWSVRFNFLSDGKTLPVGFARREW